MPRTTTFGVKQKSTAAETEISVTFDDQETETLAAYCQYAEELSKAKLVKDGFPSTLKIQQSRGGSLQFATKLPPEDDVIVLLHRLRPLILHKEHASFNRVTGLIGKRISDANIRAFLKRQRELYDGRHSQKQFQIAVGSTVINSEQVLMDWLNGFEYHRAQDKKKQIESLYAMLPMEASRAIFLMLLSDKTAAIFNVADFVGMLLGRTTEARLQS